MICTTCSLENVGPGECRITDFTKWICSPIPCPECHERFVKACQELGRQTAAKREAAMLETLKNGNVLREP